MNGISESASGVSIRVYVAPRSSASDVIGVHGGEIKIALAAPPVDGAANKELVEFLAGKLGVPKRNVSLTAGQASRHKIVAVRGVDAQTVARRLFHSKSA